MGQKKFCFPKKILGDVLPIGQMVINRIADLRRIGGLRHRFDTEQPTLLDLEVINRSGLINIVHINGVKPLIQGPQDKWAQKRAAPLHKLLVYIQ